MGRRSNFEKLPRSLYRTFDPRAGKALRRCHFPEGVKVAEPFAGAGDLIDQFPEFNWVIKSDIVPLRGDISQKDAFEVDLSDVDMVISNPPWDRPILHKAIEHFATRKPTWFLFDAPWMFTKQAQELLNEFCTDIIPVGRLKWIPDTTMSGKDDCAWYHFTSDVISGTVFHNMTEDFILPNSG